jgi:hypothetical protein
MRRFSGHPASGRSFISVATPVQVGVGQILALTENGYTLVQP